MPLSPNGKILSGKSKLFSCQPYYTCRFVELLGNMMQAPAIFVEQEDSVFAPTDYAYGPWVPNTQHGSAMMALVAYGADVFPCEYPCQVVRLTVDMMKAAPFAPVKLLVQERHHGKNMNTLEITVVADGREYVRASALRCRIQTMPVPDDLRDRGEECPLSPPLEQPLFSAELTPMKGFHHAIDIRFDTEREKDVLWLKCNVPAVVDKAGQARPCSRFVDAAMFADWTYSSWNLGNRIRSQRVGKDYRQEFFCINADNNLHVNRLPTGDWIGIQTEHFYHDQGCGNARARLLDEQGSFGISSQSLLVRPAEKAPMHIRQEAAE